MNWPAHSIILNDGHNYMTMTMTITVVSKTPQGLWTVSVTSMRSLHAVALVAQEWGQQESGIQSKPCITCVAG